MYEIKPGTWIKLDSIIRVEINFKFTNRRYVDSIGATDFYSGGYVTITVNIFTINETIELHNEDKHGTYNGINLISEFDPGNFDQAEYRQTLIDKYNLQHIINSNQSVEF